MTEFFLTVMGRRYYEHTMPELVRQLERLNENIARLAEATEHNTKPDGEPNRDEEEAPHP